MCPHLNLPPNHMHSTSRPAPRVPTRPLLTHFSSLFSEHLAHVRGWWGGTPPYGVPDNARVFGPDQTTSDVTVNGRIRPLRGPRHKPVFDRVCPTICNTRTVLRLIADAMLPKATLPDLALLLRHFRRAAWGGFPTHLPRTSTGMQTHPTREPRLYRPPTCREIRVPGRQTPHRMKMIGHDHHRIYAKRPFALRLPHGLSQCVDPVNQEPRAPVRQIDGKEIRAPLMAHTAIIRHSRKLADRR